MNEVLASEERDIKQKEEPIEEKKKTQEELALEEWSNQKDILTGTLKTLKHLEIVSRIDPRERQYDKDFHNKFVSADEDLLTA